MFGAKNRIVCSYSLTRPGLTFCLIRRGQNVCCRGDPGDLYLYQPSALINHHQAADYNGPPSYRSRTGTLRQACHLIDPAAMVMGPAAVAAAGSHHHHSRNPSQLSAMSEAVGGCGGVGMVTVADNKVPPVDDGDDGVGGVGGGGGLGVGGGVGGCGGSIIADDGVRDIVVVDEKPDHIGCGPVTILQTTPAVNQPGTVIVTVSSANNDATNVRCRETEMEILAHL